MNVVLAYASKMNGTTEIALAIGRVLDQAGITVDVGPAQHLRDVEDYDCVVLGSALYNGQWRRPALRILRRLAAEPDHRRIWLFQSAMPTGGHDPTPREVRRLAALAGARPPATFLGRLGPETAVGPVAWVRARQAGAADHRDWDQICGWACDLAAQIRASHGVSTPSNTSQIPARAGVLPQQRAPGPAGAGVNSPAADARAGSGTSDL